MDNQVPPPPDARLFGACAAAWALLLGGGTIAAYLTGATLNFWIAWAVIASGSLGIGAAIYIGPDAMGPVPAPEPVSEPAPVRPVPFSEAQYAEMRQTVPFIGIVASGHRTDDPPAASPPAASLAAFLTGTIVASPPPPVRHEA